MSSDETKQPLVDKETDRLESDDSFSADPLKLERANRAKNTKSEQSSLIKSSENSSEESDSSIESVEIMEGSMRIPPPLIFEGNIKDRWTRWKQKFNLYLIASGLSEKSEERKVAVLLNTIGEDALDKYNTFGLTPGRVSVLHEK